MMESNSPEASLASLRYGFDFLHLEQIVGLVLPENRASVRVLEKVGMQFETEFDYEGQRVARYGIVADRMKR